MSISYAYHNLIFAFPYGFQNAITAVVGNYIGEENEHRAKSVALLGFTYSALVSTTLALLTYAYAQDIARTYTGDMDIVAVLVLCLESLSLPLGILGYTLSL